MLTLFISKERCRDFMMAGDQGCATESPDNISRLALFDCAFNGDNFIFYEIQSPLGSVVGRENFLNILSPDAKKMVFANFNANKSVIRDVASEDIFILAIDFAEEGIEKIECSRHTQKAIDIAKNTGKALLIFDPLLDRHSTFAEQLMTYRHISNHANNITCLSKLHILTCSEILYHSKYFQRLLFSDTEFTPNFIFVEKKRVYSQAEVAAITHSLDVTGDEQIVIKANSKAEGRGNVFLSAAQLYDYLNSPEFTAHYSDELIILIEQAVNYKADDSYTTRRLLFNGDPGEKKLLSVFAATHRSLDSHEPGRELAFGKDQSVDGKLKQAGRDIKVNISTISRRYLVRGPGYYQEKDEACDVVTIEDDLLKSRLDHILAKIHSIDYKKLVFMLLSSEEVIFNLLGLQFAQEAFPNLYIRIEAEANETEAESLNISGMAIDMTEAELDCFERLVKGEHELIRDTAKQLLMDILRFQMPYPRVNTEARIKLIYLSTHTYGSTQDNYSAFTRKRLTQFRHPGEASYQATIPIVDEQVFA